MPKLSVIVPVYNGERYLDTCIQSMQKQTMSDIEVLLVDDGSTDGSGALCDSWAQKDGRIRVIHKGNGGPQSAVIMGVQMSEGDVIGFCDSDDFLAEDYYETLYDALMSSNADLASCQYQTAETDSDYGQRNPDRTFGLFNSADICRDFWERNKTIPIGNNRWTKLFRKDILLKVLLQLRPDLRMGEDLLMVLCYLHQSQTVCCLMNYDGYYYRKVPSSLMNHFSSSRIDSTILFSGELKRTADIYGQPFSAYEKCNDALMSNLLYKCLESKEPIREKNAYVNRILNQIIQRPGFTKEHMAGFNAVLRVGFVLLEKGHVGLGTRYCSGYIHFVQYLVGKI